MGQPKKQPTTQKSLTTQGKADLTASNDPESFAQNLKPVLMEAIQDVLDELETVYDNVSRGAKDHIHSECGVGSLRLSLLILTRLLATVKSFSQLANPRQWKPI